MMSAQRPSETGHIRIDGQAPSRSSPESVTRERCDSVIRPASAQATPMTHRSASGKQFVVIAAGGHRVIGAKVGDHVVAFTLP